LMAEFFKSLFQGVGVVERLCESELREFLWDASRARNAQCGDA
jgi:hypothetical protein